MITGYSPVRISSLQNDPAFMALVADYRNEVKAAHADLLERMANMTLDAIELLQDKLHNDPGALTVGVLLDIIKMGADRTGHGPGQEVHLKVAPDYIDRPPRESFEDWKRRRQQELSPGDAEDLPVAPSDRKNLN